MGRQFEYELSDDFQLPVNEEITLIAPDALLTDESSSYYRVTDGAVLIYVVPVHKGQITRRQYITRIDVGGTFPALSYMDFEFVSWRFLVIPASGSAKLLEYNEDADDSCKKSLVISAGIPGFEEEGFAGCIYEYYKSRQINDEGFVAETKSIQQNIAGKTNYTVVKIFEGRQPEPPDSEESALYAVVSMACKKSGIAIQDSRHIQECCGLNPSVTDIARISNFTCRKITLDRDWLTWDCGTIIATVNKKPVACWKGKGGKYYYYDGQTEQLLTKELASNLSTEACAIGRALPKRSLTKKDIVSFCSKGIPNRNIVWVLMLGLAGTLIGILQPTLNQKIYDEYIPLGDFEMVAQMCILIGTFMISNVFFSMVKKLTEFGISCHVQYDLQNAIYLRIFQLPESFFSKYNSADLAQRLMKAGPAAGTLTTEIVGTGFATVFSLFYLWRMIKYSKKLTIWALIMVLVFALLMYILESFSLKYEKMEAEMNGDAAAKLYQFIGGIDKIRMAGAEERVLLEYMVPFATEQRLNIRENRIAGLSATISDVATYIFSMVLYVVIVKKQKDISIGNFMAFNTAFGAFSAAVLQLVNAALKVYRLKPVYERVKPVMDIVPENDDQKQIVHKLNGDIQVERLSFAYDNGEEVLHDVSFTISQGEYVAIVGPSGCGKSTLLKLLLGFEKPKQGSIHYDGNNLENLDIHSLRRNLGVVLQNGKLIEGSILENVTITAPDTPMKVVKEVIDEVGLKDDIDGMPMGLQTVVNETGGTISGGQQQRILIARSIMNNPKILYFDEATSALDNKTQSKVCESLENRKMTRVVIAHRLSTVEKCSRIIVMESGRIVEQGNYKTLMAQQGLFYQLAQRQLAEESL